MSAATIQPAGIAVPTNGIALPLAYSSHRQIMDGAGNVVIQVYCGGCGVDAADQLQDKVVVAVNSHDKLLAALRDAESLIDTLALACLDRVDSMNDPRRTAITAALNDVGAA